MVRLHRYDLLYVHRRNSDKFEPFAESKTKNKSTLAFGEVEHYLGSDVISGDIDVHKVTVLKICFEHPTDYGVAWL